MEKFACISQCNDSSFNVGVNDLIKDTESQYIIRWWRLNVIPMSSVLGTRFTIIIYGEGEKR